MATKKEKSISTPLNDPKDHEISLENERNIKRFRESQIKKASIIGVIGNLFLALAKIIGGSVFGSIALISDGVDSASDVITSLISWVTAKLMAKPPNPKFPYGFSRAETIATSILAFIMFFSGVQLVIASVSEIINPSTNFEINLIPIVITIVSIVMKSGLAYYKMQLGKKLQSTLLIADGKNMAYDILTSIFVLLGLIVESLTNWPFADKIAAILVSVWIIRNAIDIYWKANIEIMDGMEDTSIYDQIFKVLEEIPQVKNPHRIRVRRMGYLLAVVLDIEMDPELRISDAHDICNEVEEQIKKCLKQVYDVTVHVDPAGNNEFNESFGISKDHL
jgi:cation diffusion facilitator family transporter